ncbi:hypothetical protein PG996_004091 [Apiospora saccharicola]|uniref:Zn(2)-C6 fungal-type domain-containing protein n=1 Tax=Apiospora saccharicola TaxID=335842 RepID=A0ABR1W371_9PEZI
MMANNAPAVHSNGFNQPLKRRAACDACRKRKIKCAGGTPVCQRCGRLVIPCHYSDVARSSPHEGDPSLAEGLVQPASSMPEFDMAFLDNVPWLDWTNPASQLSPSIAWDNFPTPTGEAGDHQDTQSQSSSGKRGPCDCAILAHKHFSILGESHEGLEPLRSLREAAQVAKKLLTCDFFVQQKTRLAGKGSEQQTLTLGHGPSASPDSLVELRVGSAEYLALLKSGIRVDATSLSAICDEFAQRQQKLHNEGHEQCAKGRPCQSKDASGCSKPSQHSHAICPKATTDDPRRFFLCFQAVRMVRASIEELQAVLEDEALASPYPRC